MDRRFLTVLGVSLLFALVVSSVFYQMSSRAGNRNKGQKVATATMVVAAAPLSLGVLIRPADVKLATVPRDRVPKTGFQKIEEVVGRSVISNILQDEAVVTGRLAERGSGIGLSPVIPRGMRAVAVKVNEVVGVAGFVLPGLRVDVLVTVRPPDGAAARTVTILQNVPVVSAGQQLQPDRSGQAVNVPVVTLLVTPEQAEVLTLAGNEGRIQLVLRNSGDKAVTQPSGRDMTELYARRPAAKPAPAKPAPRPVAAAPAPPVVVPDDEIVVIRGTQRSIEHIDPGRPDRVVR